MSFRLPPSSAARPVVEPMGSAAAVPKAKTGAFPLGTSQAGQYRGNALRAPPVGARPYSTRGMPRNRPPPPPRRRRGNPLQSDGVDLDIRGLDEDGDDSNPMALSSQTGGFNLDTNRGSADAESGSGGEGSHKEGERQVRAFKVIRQAADEPALRLASALPVTHAVAAKLTLVQWVQALRRPALGGVAQPRSAAPSTVALAMQIARHWLTRTPEQRQASPATLSEVRELLIQEAGSAPNGHPSPPPLWLPIFLLNLGRPRTPLQADQASQRLHMLERASRGSNTSGGD